MDEFLKHITTRKINKNDELIIKESSQIATGTSRANDLPTPANPESALSSLSSQPSSSSLYKTLTYLNGTTSVHREAGFNVLVPSAKAAQIVFTLVNNTIPTFWPELRGSTNAEGKGAKQHLIRVLRSSSGFGALLAKLKADVEEGRADAKKKHESLQLAVEVFTDLLKGDRVNLALWKDVNYLETRPERAEMWWKEVCAMLASGRIISLVAEADALLSESTSNLRQRSWIADASAYSSWLGKNVRHMLNELSEEEWSDRGTKGTAAFLSRGLALGYPDSIINEIFMQILQGREDSLLRLRALLATLSDLDQQTVIYSAIRTLVEGSWTDEERMIQGSGALISELCKECPTRFESLQDWLVGTAPESINYKSQVRRAVVLALSHNLEALRQVVWKALEQFGDKLYIKHSPTLHQEVNAQIILICLSHLRRKDTSILTTMTKSSVYLTGVSNHLASSSPKIRFLGMVLGLAVSEKVDEPEKRLKFTSDGFDQTEWDWYKSLIDIRDHPDTIALLKQRKDHSQTIATVTRSSGLKILSSSKRASATTSKVFSIEEIDDSESEDDDLPTYAKPDSDPSDDDEDPTLVQRNKPTAPVYIKDLLAGLQDAEDYDKHTLALRNAPDLIRRKTNFGSEVQDHLTELAAQIIGLKDRWELEDFSTLRLRGMLAVLLADPKTMGPHFANSFYTGDLSLSQRGAILSCLGLAAREIAALGADDVALTGADAMKDAFPSKRLPSKLHDHYSLDAAPTNRLVADLSRMMIQPLAAEAADKISGPNALKVRTFSSRMDVEKKRPKPTQNKLAKIVAEAFFFPLTGRWQLQTQAIRFNSPQASPMLLSQFLKTLSLILHAAGLTAPALPQLTSEFWDLLLSLRVKADDQSVLEALLFAFLMLLEVNEDKQRALTIEHAKELLETQEWVGAILENLRGGDEEGERCRMLAAGVLVKCKEIVEKHQRLLLGDMIDYMH